MIDVCGEALIDLFVGPAEGAEMPARAMSKRALPQPCGSPRFPRST
jgi:hypothetical protein